MDADLPAGALAVCDLRQRRNRGRAGPGLDRGPGPLYDWLLESRQQARAGLWYSGRCSDPALVGRGMRNCVAPCSRMMAESPRSRADSACAADVKTRHMKTPAVI